MTCPDCTQAESRAWHGYRSGCTGCRARAMSESPEFHTATRAGQITPGYRDAMRRVFGQEWQAHHEAVKHWATLREGRRG